MKSEQDATKNQKVFVTLASVLDLQREYLRTLTNYQEIQRQQVAPSVQNESMRLHRQKLITFEQVFTKLGLPIQLERP